MQERERYQLATIAAETMCNLWELGYQQGELDLDQILALLGDRALDLIQEEDRALFARALESQITG